MQDHAFGFQVIPPARRIRFGPFEADCRTGELRKHGIKVRIGQQTFQILTMLLEHSGEIVSRDDLRRRLWPDDTFVDFDRSLNTAIGRLREALDDSADNPRFIETVPRRGYRFIAPVEKVAAPARNQGLIAAAPATLPISASVSRAPRTLWRWVAIGVDQLLKTGNCCIKTPRGVIEAWFERPGLEPGALGIIATTIGETGGNIDRIDFVPQAADFREMLIDLEVWDIKHLNAILSQLRGKNVVSKVERVSG